LKPEHKERVVEEVISRIVDQIIANSDTMSLETVINDTIFHERKRCDEKKKTRKTKKEILYWKQLKKRLISANEEDKRKMLRELVTQFAEEIVGNFNPKVYKFESKVLPVALSVMLNAMSPWNLIKHLPKFPDLSDRIIIEGEIEQIQALQKLGTLILVPTHLSNMDSIVIGWSLYKINLPPFIYGAGINLFTNKILSYFMHNLGAYKVDRKKTANLYKQTLKEYATCTLEFGYHNLFFPGGTRSRSGEIEHHLKLGLLGSSMHAYINNLKHQKDKPNFYVVPCTLSYQVVLEAERLIGDALKLTGKSQYIMEDDEFSQVHRIYDFLQSLLKLDSKIYVRICPAMDLFGNKVDNEGKSYDKHGRQIDITQYVKRDNELVYDEQRDHQYTSELGVEIAKSYMKNNVIMCTHVVAFSIFRILINHNEKMDLYHLLRTGGKEDTLPMREVFETMNNLMELLKEKVKQGEIAMDHDLQDARIEDIFEDAVKHFKSYHKKVVLVRKGDRLYPTDRNLLYYYHNRLLGYGFEKELH
jgi:glycerol-3-phosphate O-acyltransferase